MERQVVEQTFKRSILKLKLYNPSGPDAVTKNTWY